MPKNQGTLSQNPLEETMALCPSSQVLFASDRTISVHQLCELFEDPGSTELLLFLQRQIQPSELAEIRLNLKQKKDSNNMTLQMTGSSFQGHYIYHYVELPAPPALLSDDLFLLNTIINGIGDPIFVKDNAHQWMLLNDPMCKLMGVERQNFIGKSDYDFFPKEEADHFWRQDNEVFLSETPLEREELLTDANQITHTILTKKSTARLLNGKQILIGVIRDISKRKDTEGAILEKQATLETENKLKNKFMNIISHELRTPLNGVLGMARLLSETGVSDKQQKLIDIIAASGQNLLTIINEILDYSSISAGTVTLHEEQINPHKLIYACAEQMTQRFTYNNNQTSIHVDPAVPECILSDGNRFSQVINQLLENAHQFCQDAHITVSLELHGSHATHMLRLKVEDTGPGINKEDLPHIFDHFFQGDSSSTRHSGGSGLGLSLAKQILNAMGGKITATSEGCGALFQVLIPFQLTAVNDQISANAQNNTNSHTQCLYRLQEDGTIITQVAPKISRTNANTQLGLQCPLFILVAEDNPINQQVLLGMLRLLGYENVVLAEDGYSAVEKCKERHFDLILMDINMPRMDGIEATRLIRKSQDNSPIFIAAITSNSGVEESKRCQGVGMQAHLPKPYNLGSLEKLLEACFEERPSSSSSSSSS